MNTTRAFRPYLWLALAWLAFAAFVWWSSASLPSLVAVHFGVNGVPNNWETRGGYIQFTLIFGAIVPAFILAMFSLIRFGDGSLMNIPHKDYWLAPERRRETFAYVERQSAWLAGLLVAFFAGVHYFVLSANASGPAFLSPKLVLWCSAGFVAVVMMWVGVFIRHFFRTPA